MEASKFLFSTSDLGQGNILAIGINTYAVYVNFTSKNKWFATDNLCPHKKQMILSRGMIGETGDTPKVACPFHKKTFSLEDGKCLDDDYCIDTYPVKVEDGYVYIAV